MRKALLIYAAGAFLSGLLMAQEIKNDWCGARYEKGKLALLGSAGETLVEIGDISIGSSLQARIAGAEKTSGQEMKINYEILKGQDKLQSVTGTCQIDGNRIVLHNHATAEMKSMGAVMVSCQAVKGQRKGKVDKAGNWVRYYPEFGGTPYEVRDMYMVRYPGRDTDCWQVMHGNFHWRSAQREHLGLKAVKDETGKFASMMEFFVAPKGYNAEEAAAVYGKRPYAVTFSSENTYNFWEDGTPEFTVRVRKTFAGADNSKLKVTAYDFDGKKVLEREESLKNDPADVELFKYRLPADEHNIYFVEASAGEVFNRTNIGLMPVYRVQHPEKSIMGMAAYYKDSPDRESALKLLQRIGVRYLRHEDNTVTLPQYGIISYFHTQIRPKIFDANDPKDVAQLKKWVDDIQKKQCPVWEYGNEVGWKKPKEEAKRLMECYASWLKAIRTELDSRGLTEVKLTSFGIQLFDKYLHSQLKESGAFDLLDELSLHPGRGCYTPDHTRGAWWSYAGIIRNSKKNFEKLGQSGKKVNLTEAYAGTHPHDGWKDSYRSAAENIILSVAIALAENMSTFMFYEMHHGISFDHNGIGHRSAEYDFGLLMRDNSPKASLLAYAASSKYFDGADFIRYFELKDTEVKGIEFNTPRGKMAVIYDRTDGGDQSKWTKHPEGLTRKNAAGKDVAVYVFKEPWMDHWQSHIKHTFNSSKDKIIVGDVIGREKEIPVKNGKVELVLSGAPMIVYGLDLP